MRAPRADGQGVAVSEILLDTDDLGEAEAVLAEQFARIRLSASTGAPTGFRITQSGTGPLTFQELDYGADFRYDAEPMPNLMFCVPHSGGFDQRLPGVAPVYAGPGAVVALGAHHGVPFSGDVHAGRFSQLVLDAKVLDETAATSFAPAGRPVRLTGLRPIDDEANTYFTRVIEYVRDVAGRVLNGTSPVLAGEIRRHVAAAVLATFPNTARFDVDVADRRDGTPQHLRRAIAFVDDNAARDISLVDIAAAAAVTPRALQYLFRRHRDVTPLEYLRRVRLHHAHVELASADPTAVTVGEVARRWGFGHAGRFAAFHRESYGESPIRTLRSGT